MRLSATIWGVATVFALYVAWLVPAKGTQTVADKYEQQMIQGSQVVIKSKPEPERPSTASEGGINATVVLRVVFRASGKVTDIQVVRVVPEHVPKKLS
jgi:outer membrane biosynthesis protein TonB